jgi:hypothetical protein
VTIVQGPFEAVENSSTGSKRRRRWPWYVAAGTLVTALCVFIGLWIWALHYQPLGINRELGGAGRLTAAEPGPLSPDARLSNFLGTEYVVRYPHAGDHIGLGFSIHNAGRHDVTVTDVHLLRNSVATWVRETVFMAPNGNGSLFGRVPFRRFTLRAGETREFVAVLSVGKCPTGMKPIRANAGFGGFQSVSVSSEAFGVHRRSDLKLAEQALSIEGWPLCEAIR